MSGRRSGAHGSSGPLRAAEYIRMSTEHQQYSIDNQQATIQHFAEAHNYIVVQSFIDAGKSGVGIQGRDALQDLLRVVESGEADFSAILVYDVSRWGRFQEPDEGAYYEFRCIRANITVQYCAEQFPQDNAPMSAVMKSLKRAMAGEYSRELSAKVFAGQCRLTKLGFRQGGTPGYGMRRLLLDQHGNPKLTLAPGERKSFQLERVILTPGPDIETDTVRRVYELFVAAHKTEVQIAAILNDEGIATTTSRPWTRGTVHELLTNEKYIGNNVYNRTSTKLQQSRVKNKREDWVCCENAYTSIVDADLYAAAQQIISDRDRHYTDQELLDLLRNLFKQRGTLSGLIINETQGMPSAATYRYRFQSLYRAYELIGFNPRRDISYIAINRALRAFHREHLLFVIRQLEETGATVRRNPVSEIFTINDEFTAALNIARCRKLREEEYRWVIYFDTSLNPDITIAVRMAPDNIAILDYYLFPNIDVLTDYCRLARVNGFVLDTYRFDDLTALVNLSRRSLLLEAA